MNQPEPRSALFAPEEYSALFVGNGADLAFSRDSIDYLGVLSTGAGEGRKYWRLSESPETYPLP